MENLPSLRITDKSFAVCRLDPESRIPEWGLSGSWFAVTRTMDELSIVCEECAIPEAVRCERDWRMLKVEGPLDFSLIGILSGITGVLAAAAVSVFVVSTFDTDYILVRNLNLERALMALAESGYSVQPLQAPC